MVESNQTSHNADQPNNGQDDSRPYGDMYWVYIIGAWAFIGLLLAAIFWPNMTERLKFFVATLWVLVTAFAVIAQVRINHRQWQIMEGQWRVMGDQLKAMDDQRALVERSIESAEKNSIYAQRAYVVAKIRDIGEKDDTLQFRLRIENSGNTPANDVTVLYAYGLRESSPHSKAPDSEIVVYDIGFTETERLGLIAPNGSYQVLSTPEVAFEHIWSQENKRFEPRDYERFVAGELQFYCWGRIVYEDIFNEKRHTEFCFVQSVAHPNGYPCKYGNYAM